MIIDGRAIAQQLNFHTKFQVEKLSFQPLLVDVLVGNDPASVSYVKIKQRKAEQCGFAFELAQLSESFTTEQVIAAIEQILLKPNLSGLLVQLPLPSHLDEAKILQTIPVELDVDVLSQQSRQNFYTGQSKLQPPTAGSILHILDNLTEPIQDLQYLVLGQGELVGLPTTYLLQQRGFKVWTADSNTENVSELLSQADCIISGVGKPNLISGPDLKPHCIVIDAGTSEASGSITGDVDFESVSKIVQYITPVPGGVGPVTVAKLLENVLLVAMNRS